MPRLLLALLVVAAGVRTPPARASSDLSIEIYGLALVQNASVDVGDVAEGCAGSTSGLTLFRFGTRLRNLGPDELSIGPTDCPDCTEMPGAACGNPLFVCSQGLYDGYQRAHFISAAAFDLLDPAGAVVVSGPKRSYCFNDDACVAGVTPKFTSCDVQGLSVGCTDDYTNEDPCQYLDVTGVADVARRAFTLRVTVDTKSLLDDPNRANNVAEVKIPGCGDGIVQPGEDCDAGPAGSSCCDAECRFVGAGTTCRAGDGPCGTPSTCTGTSADCPPAAAPPPSCVIEGACVAAGTVNPSDACASCVPTTRTDAWTRNESPDATGITCTLDELTTMVASLPCSARLAHAIAAPLRQLHRQIAKGAATTPTKRTGRTLVRLAQRLQRTLTRAARHAHCDATTASQATTTLMTQVQTLSASH